MLAPIAWRLMKPTLLVLAAGMGSRFGGLKQMEPVGQNGEWILDYSVHDARKAGFGKVVFVIRQEMEADFRELTENKYASQIDVAYAFQEKADTPIPVATIDTREKPWGTGHAVYAAREHLDAPFAVINADDFYGFEAFDELARFLTDASLQGESETYALVGYDLANTLSDHGTVSRGVCSTDANEFLASIEEHTQITRNESGSITALDGSGQPVTLSPNTLVSLNCWGFPAGWATKLEQLFIAFLNSEGEQPRSEFYLPSAVDALIAQGQGRAQALRCSATWLGVTHREDLPVIKEAIAKLIANGSYQSPL